MKIGIDISPLETSRSVMHRVRGTGFYIKHLTESLNKYVPQHEYVYFTNVRRPAKKLDLVHIPYFEPFFLTIPFIKSVKTVVTVHDLTPLVFPDEFPRGLRGELKWKIQRYLLNSVDHIITDSYASMNDIVKYTKIPEEKISVVYLAPSEIFKKISSHNKKTEIRKKYQLPEQFALYVGDATWNKNLPRLIKSIETLNIDLIVVGKALTSEKYDKENPWNKDLKMTQDLARGNKKVKLLGFIPDEDLVLLYNLANVFVMPSLYEGFGLPILEAMSCGCPVITTEKGSLKEVAGEAALFVDPYSVENIAEGIDKAFHDSLLKEKLIEKGLKNIQRFSWKDTAFQTNKVYEKFF